MAKGFTNLLQNAVCQKNCLSPKLLLVITDIFTFKRIIGLVLSNLCPVCCNVYLAKDIYAPLIVFLTLQSPTYQKCMWRRCSHLDV